jgi:membrane protease YdiL (CAAX protease family)
MDIFYFAIAGIFVIELLIEKGIVKMLRKHVDFFKKEGFWRRGFAGQLVMTFFSIAIMGLLGFGEEFGLTLRNINESLRLFLLFGLPFAVFYSVGAYLFIRKSEGALSIGWMRNPSNRNGHLIYCFTMNGVGEELFYRGLIQGSLSIRLIGFMSLGSFDLMYSTTIASILFILIHLENVIDKDETMEEFFLNLPYRTIIAFMLGITFQLTGSLLAPIIIHNTSNGFLSIAAWQATKQ